jgi:hypothetical protein
LIDNNPSQEKKPWAWYPPWYFPCFPICHLTEERGNLLTSNTRRSRTRRFIQRRGSLGIDFGSAIRRGWALTLCIIFVFHIFIWYPSF